MTRALKRKGGAEKKRIGHQFMLDKGSQAKLKSMIKRGGK